MSAEVSAGGVKTVFGGIYSGEKDPALPTLHHDVGLDDNDARYLCSDIVKSCCFGTSQRITRLLQTHKTKRRASARRGDALAHQTQ